MMKILRNVLRILSLIKEKEKTRETVLCVNRE